MVKRERAEAGHMKFRKFLAMPFFIISAPIMIVGGLIACLGMLIGYGEIPEERPRQP